MFTPQPIGFVRSPYLNSSEIPKGLGVKPEFEPGLGDIDGFSHLFVLWEFDRSDGFNLSGVTPVDNRPHGVFATRSPRAPQPHWSHGC